LQLFANESIPEHVGFARVKISLINENDNRPVFSKALYNVSLPENATVGTTVLQVHVSRSIPAANPTCDEEIGVCCAEGGKRWEELHGLGWLKMKMWRRR